MSEIEQLQSDASETEQSRSGKEQGAKMSYATMPCIKWSQVVKDKFGMMILWVAK